MLTRPELKNDALRTLRGKWKLPVLTTLVLSLIGVFTSYSGNIAVSAIYFAFGSLIALFVSLNLDYGFEVAMLRFNRGRENTLNETFNAGLVEDYARVLGIMLLQALYVILWMLLLIIPGIIKSYSYSMTNFIAEDNPELSPMECIDRSMAMMKGHKWELFVLELSFIGWALLCVLTLFIGYLWLVPYMQMTFTKFYEKILVEYENAGNVSEL